MKILVVGGGEIGKNLTTQLAHDGYQVTVIDREESVVNSMGNSVDAICLQGNGDSYSPLQDSGEVDEDILIDVTT